MLQFSKTFIENPANVKLLYRSKFQINSFGDTFMKPTSSGDRKTIHGDPERF